jgi:hypothetical protein
MAATKREAQWDGCKQRTLNDAQRREITPAWKVYARRGADDLSLSASPTVDHRLGKGLQSFLRQITIDAQLIRR